MIRSERYAHCSPSQQLSLHGLNGVAAIAAQSQLSWSDFFRLEPSILPWTSNPNISVREKEAADLLAHCYSCSDSYSLHHPLLIVTNMFKGVESTIGDLWRSQVSAS